METAMKIRRRILIDGESIRSVNRTTGLSRTTIRKYLEDDHPPRYKTRQAGLRSILRGFESTLVDWYEADLARPKRERRTAQKLFEQLVLEGYPGTYSPVCRFIKQLRENGNTRNQAFIPMTFEAGDAMQFDWSQEVVVLGGLEQKIKVAHFKLSYSRQPFIIAYPRETQEMLLDAYSQAFQFYQGLPKRVLIDNPKTMVKRIGKGKEREFPPRFLAMMNHYLIEPVACTPASGWEKGQVERQVDYLRKAVFTPKLNFATLAELNHYLLAQCKKLGDKPHPQDKSQTIQAMLIQEQGYLRPVGRSFDGYVEKIHRASSTCLVQYDNNYYSVPSEYAKQKVSLRAYALTVVIYAGQQEIAKHIRSFKRHDYCFEPWHYVPLLASRPGALRDGAPFKQWALPKPIETIKAIYLKRPHGDRDFVELLKLIQQHAIEPVSLACECAIQDKTTQLSAIINLINRLVEPPMGVVSIPDQYPSLTVLPEANCQRYEQLTGGAL